MLRLLENATERRIACEIVLMQIGDGVQGIIGETDREVEAPTLSDRRV